MCNGIDQLAGAVGKALEVAPDLYDDALKPAAQESGKALSRIPKLINAVLSPLDIWILNKEYNVEKTKKLIANKLEHIEPDKIVSPEPYVAVPAIQAISYSMNSEELREMYANLLANSMNSDFKDSVHPAFVEIIKQLSPFEATLLKKFTDTKSFPIVVIRRCIDEKRIYGEDCQRHIMNPQLGLTISNLSNFATAIDNLSRLNLINVDYEKSYKEKSYYNDILNSSLVSSFKQSIESSNYCNVFDIQYGMLEISDLGKSFINICII